MMIKRDDDNSPFIIRRAASHTWNIPAQVYAYTSLYYDYSNDHHDFARCCLIKLFFYSLAICTRMQMATRHTFSFRSAHTAKYLHMSRNRSEH